MNPLNPQAARRASKRIDAALRAVKQIVSISQKKDKGVSAAGGKVVKFKTRSRRKTG
jgi:ABC-type enterochelin transport system substrate-binding protein